MNWLTSLKESIALSAIIVVVIGSVGYFPEWQIGGGILAFVLSWLYDFWIWWRNKRCKHTN